MIANPDMYLQLHAARRRDLLNEANQYRLSRAAHAAVRRAAADRTQSRSLANHLPAILRSPAGATSVKRLLAWMTR
jgi:hypothetical protein